MQKYNVVDAMFNDVFSVDRWWPRRAPQALFLFEVA